MARKSKTYFFDAPDNSSGKKFSRYNHPTKEVFQELFDSLPFLQDVEDTAKESESGHIRLATDTEAKTRVKSGNFSKAVQPHQLPTIISNETEVIANALTHKAITVTPVEKTVAGKTRLSYKVEVAADYSLAIDLATQKLMLVNDIPTIGAIDEEKFYGIRDGVRGYYRVLPESEVGVLRSILITPETGDPYYKLEWDNSFSSGSGEVYSRLLLASFTSVNYTGTGPQVLKAYNMPMQYMVVGAKIKIRAVFEMAANLNRSSISCVIGLTNGDTAPVPLALRKDGNVSGFVEVEGTVSILSDGTLPEILMYHGKSYNSSEPSEVIVHSSRTGWDCTPNTYPLRIQLIGNRDNTVGNIICHSLEVEFIK